MHGFAVTMSSTPATLTDGAETPSSARPRHHHHHTHLHGAGARIKQLLHPDGRTIHVVGNPDEAHRMSQTLRLNKKKHSDLVVYGSLEHVRLHAYWVSQTQQRLTIDISD